MRYFLIFSFLFLPFQFIFSQVKNNINQNPNNSRMYFYWGWNSGHFTKSNIRFKGPDYDFTLKKSIAKDRQTKFTTKYFNPAHITIPQYNFRVGYYIRENWDFSFGIDHMKYVLQNNQEVEISGIIENSNTIYDGVYNNNKILVSPDFLKFEHTDGLNYVNFELRHSTKILDMAKIKVSLKEGFGIGALVPRTNTKLLNNETYDKFHFSGYGLGAILGLNISFFNAFFIQNEIKGGFINLPNVRTTSSKFDKASHHFFFGQFNIVFGGIINLNKKNDQNEVLKR